MIMLTPARASPMFHNFQRSKRHLKNFTNAKCVQVFKKYYFKASKFLTSVRVSDQNFSHT